MKPLMSEIPFREMLNFIKKTSLFIFDIFNIFYINEHLSWVARPSLSILHFCGRTFLPRYLVSIPAAKDTNIDMALLSHILASLFRRNAGRIVFLSSKTFVPQI